MEVKDFKIHADNTLLSSLRSSYIWNYFTSFSTINFKKELAYLNVSLSQGYHLR
jgi:hypothetical protein